MTDKFSIAISKTAKGLRLEDFLVEVDAALADMAKALRGVTGPFEFMFNLNVRNADEESDD